MVDDDDGDDDDGDDDGGDNLFNILVGVDPCF